MRLSRIILCTLLLGCSSLRAGGVVTIDLSKSSEPISKYVYGQFIEHLGKCIQGGMWAEMLEDRKFFFPIGDKYDPWGTREDAMWLSGPYKFLKASPWKMLGQTEMIAMDPARPYTGAHSVAITAPGSGAETGISQEDLAIVAGRKYVGKVILAGEGELGAVVVRLALEDGSMLAQSIETIDAEFHEYPIEFTAKASSSKATFDIVCNGNGKLWIGAVSLMPADNINGWRSDVVALLKELDAPIYRWPGGNFVSGYDWKDGIGPRDKRAPRKNPAWTSAEMNDVGIHEFMDLMNTIHSEPFVALNMGLGTVADAAAEVEYIVGSPDSEMGKLRAANGHPEPFKATYWAVGNEMYGRWQLGFMPQDQYIKKHNEAAAAIWKIDPKAQLVAVGELGTWTQNMFKGSASSMSLLSEHIYAKELPDPIAHAKQLADQIKVRAEAHRKYRKEIPELAGKDIRIAMDEWNYWYGPYVFGELGVRYRLKDGLGVALGLHEFYRNSDLFFVANYAQTVNVLGAIKTTPTASAFEATGLVLKLYRKEFGTIPVSIAQQPEGLDVSAAWNADRSNLTLSVVNLTDKADSITLEFAGGAFKESVRKFEISGTDLQAYNDPGKPLPITIQESAEDAPGGKLNIAPRSATIYRFEKR